MLNLPNFLTLLRIVAIPIFLILLEGDRCREALAVFIAAGVTDGLDGAIARLTHSKTELGAYLDPAADKLLLLSAFIALGFMHEVPRWLIVVVLSRDVVIVLGYFLLFMLTSETMAVRPSASGKLATFLQLLSVTIVLVSLVKPALIAYEIEAGVFYATGAVTGIAGLQYMYRGLLWLQAESSSADAPPKSAGPRDRRQA
jgi:cardiolipin synthase